MYFAVENQEGTILRPKNGMKTECSPLPYRINIWNQTGVFVATVNFKPSTSIDPRPGEGAGGLEVSLCRRRLQSSRLLPETG